MEDLTFIEKRLLAHYHKQDHENLYPIQIAHLLGATLEEISVANLNLLRLKKIELRDITG